ADGACHPGISGLCSVDCSYTWTAQDTAGFPLHCRRLRRAISRACLRVVVAERFDRIGSDRLCGRVKKGPNRTGRGRAEHGVGGTSSTDARSEERRVGKECRACGWGEWYEINVSMSAVARMARSGTVVR